MTKARHTHPARIGPGLLLLVAVAVAVAGCERRHEVGVRIVVPDGAAPASLELRVYERRGCVEAPTVAGGLADRDGSVHQQVFSPEMGGGEVGALGGGDHAFAVLGRDEDCNPVLFGCAMVKLSSADVVAIELGPYVPPDGASACGSERQCAGAGMCVASPSPTDAAGMDAPPSDGARDAGGGSLGCDEVLACFDRCEVESECVSCVEDAMSGPASELAQCISGACGGFVGDELDACVQGNCEDRLGACSGEDAGTPPPTVTQLVAGASHTCALRDDGRVLCWGNNAQGNLGNLEVTESVAEPSFVLTEDGSTLAGVTRIDAGTQHTCALTEDGVLWCWGRNADGAFGFGDDRVQTPYATPVPDDALTYIEAAGADGETLHFALGAFHTCAAAGDRVTCFGRNDTSQLGGMDGMVGGFELSIIEGRVTALMAGNAFGCALTEAGSMSCWGDNTQGQLGDGSTVEDRAAPEPVRDADGPIAGLSFGIAGAFHACATIWTGMGDPEGTYCWGANADGQIGADAADTTVSPAVRVDPEVGGFAILPVAAGWYHSCFMAPSLERIACIGRNDDGQLGDGTTASRSGASTDDLVDLDAVEQVVAGAAHTCALASGSVYCWGSNGEQQLGPARTDTGDLSTTPIEVTGLTADP